MRKVLEYGECFCHGKGLWELTDDGVLYATGYGTLYCIVNRHYHDETRYHNPFGFIYDDDWGRHEDPRIVKIELDGVFLPDEISFPEYPNLKTIVEKPAQGEITRTM